MNRKTNTPVRIFHDYRSLPAPQGLLKKTVLEITKKEKKSDGKPVHVMMLLGTSRELASRHLEVLAALSRAVRNDKDFGKKLVNAESPAHVYDLFHDREAEDFNTFLEE